MESGTKTIVVAWTTGEYVHDGKPFARDLGRAPRMVAKVVPHACLWLKRGDSADIAKAAAYIEREEGARGRVFTYPTNERDPVGRALRDVARCSCGVVGGDSYAPADVHAHRCVRSRVA